MLFVMNCVLQERENPYGSIPIITGALFKNVLVQCLEPATSGWIMVTLSKKSERLALTMPNKSAIQEPSHWDESCHASVVKQLFAHLNRCVHASELICWVEAFWEQRRTGDTIHRMAHCQGISNAKGVESFCLLSFFLSFKWWKWKTNHRIVFGKQ